MNIEEPIDDPELERKVMVSVPTNGKIQNWFTYHPPTQEDVEYYREIRDAGMNLAKVIDEVCPPSADTSAAIRKVREAVMTANAAIACCE